ncbi:MAG TPA: ferredoxin--NADP reductase, partial [Planctomycetaceae bacterium]|nr:ferredoxin--NADP reductase [Planctomycetaceae bacterium]
MTLPERDELRRAHYNARVVQIRRVHDELMVLRAAPDPPHPVVRPGQYTVLGLGVWEPRVDGVPSSRLGEGARPGLIRRAYSLSCPMLDDRGKLATVGDLPFLEFYLNRIYKPRDEPPMLTPRLFRLSEGDRLYVGRHATGHYTLEAIHGGENVIFMATGTGEAPHNAMVAELLRRRHKGRIAVITCARFRRDLAYLEVHRALERCFPGYRYIALTTREPENLVASDPGYIGKKYLQDWIACPDVADQIGFALEPVHTHAFLCGAPAMIGLPT